MTIAVNRSTTIYVEMAGSDAVHIMNALDFLIGAYDAGETTLSLTDSTYNTAKQLQAKLRAELARP